MLLLRGLKLFPEYACSSSLQHHFVVVFGSMLSHGIAHMLGSTPATLYCHTPHHCQNRGFEVW